MTTDIVKTFWPLINDHEVIDILFDRIETFPDKTELGTPSVALAKKYYKGAKHQVAAIASNPRTDPAVLNLYTADTRVFVRRHLIMNQNTPYDSLLALADWAVERDDKCMALAIARLTLGDAIETLSKHIHDVNDYFLDGTKLAERCCAEPELTLKLAAVKNRGVTEALASLVNNGRITSVTLKDLGQVEPRHIQNILMALLKERAILTMDLAQLWLTWTYNGGKDSSGVRTGHLGVGASLETFSLVDIDAANALASGNIQQLRTAVVSGGDSDIVHARILKLDAEELLYITCALENCSMSVACELAIAERFMAVEGWKHSTANVILSRLHHPLPDDTLLRMLCPADNATISWWLKSPNHPNGVRAGLLTKLWQDAGIVNLDTDGRDYAIIAASAVYAASMTPFLLKEVVPLFDHYIGTNLKAPVIAKMIYPILAKAFRGSGKTDLWNTFFALGEEWNCTLTALIQTAYKLIGFLPEPDTEEEKQLQLPFN